jgi:hypothetical protein
MFSSTTIASSITMPTASVSEQRHAVQREAGGADEREAGDDRRRDRQRRDDDDPEVPDERHDHEAGEEAAEQQVLLERRDRRVDELRVVARDGDLHFRRQRPAQAVELGADRLDHLHGVLPRLPPHVHQERALAVEECRRARLGRRVLDRGDVAQTDRRPARGGRHDDVRELLGRFEPAQRAQRQLGVPLLDVAARHLDVLGHDRVAHAVHGEAVRVQLLDVEDHLDLARLAARDGDLADAVHGFDRAPDLLVGDLGQRAQGQRSRQREADDGIRVRVHLGNDRRLDFRRQILDRLRHLLAHVLRRVVDVPLEDELERDPAVPLADHRRHLVDAGNAAQRLFGRLDDGAVQFLGAGAGQVEVDHDGRRVRLRQQIDAEIAEREHTRDHEQHHQHGGEDRASYAEVG